MSNYTLQRLTLKGLKKDLSNARLEKEQLKDAVLTYEKYLELFANVADLLRSNTKIETLNAVLSKFFSNLIVKGEFVPPKNKITRWEVVDYKLKEP